MVNQTSSGRLSRSHTEGAHGDQGIGRQARRLWPIAFAILPAIVHGQEEVIVTEMFPHNAPQTLTGICFHKGSIYAPGKDNILIRYNPESGELEEVVDPLVPDLTDPHLHGITVGEVDTFWVGDTESAQLFELQFSDYSVVTVLDAPPGRSAYGLTFRDGVLWVAHHRTGGAPSPIHAINPHTGEVLEEFNVGVSDVHGMAWVGGYLWALDQFDDTAYKISDDGEVRATYTLPEDWWGSLAYDGEHFWTHNLSSFFQVGLPIPCEGDANGDGTVDPLDGGFVLARFGCSVGTGNPDCDAADVNGDGEVNPLDNGFVLARFGECP